MRRRPLVSAALAMAMLTACAVPVTPGAPGERERELATGGPKKVLPHGAGLIGGAGGNVVLAGGLNLITPESAGAVSLAEAGLVETAGAAISGTVTVPAGVVSAGGLNLIGGAGGNVVSAGGGNVVSAGGLNFRLAALDEAPAGSTRVHVLNAEGKVVIDAQGAPLTADTDAAGRFTLAGYTPSRNLILAVPFLKDLGRLQAVLPKGDPAGKAVEVDTVSTLTTTYIREQYVNGQPDPQATLDRLTPEAEAETRRRAEAAVEVAPERFTPAALVAAVEALRQQNGAFDAQLEVVKRLLIAAGQSDMGSGRPGTEVALGGVQALLAAADGSLAIAAAADRRVWRLGPTGRLETLAGSGEAPGTGFQPRAAKDAALLNVKGLARDSQGRLLVLEDGGEFGTWRLTRVDADGVLRQVTAGDLRAAVSGPEGGLLVLRWDNGWTLATVNGDRVETKVRFDTPSEAKAAANTVRYGADAAGRLYLASGQPSLPEGFDAGIGELGLTLPHHVMRIDPATGAREVLAKVGADGVKGLSVDAQGNMFIQDDQGKLRVRKPDGSERVLATTLPAGFSLRLDGVALLDDGAYVAQHGTQVHRVKDGAFTPVAGLAGAPAETAGSVALQSPAGLAVTREGHMIVTDLGAHRVVRIAADGATRTIAGTGTEGDAGENVPAATSPLRRPGLAAADAAGNVYVAELGYSGGHRLRRIAPDGTLSTVHSVEGGSLISLAVAADGTAYVATYHNPSETVRFVEIRRKRPGGSWELLAGQADRLTNSGLRLALATDGRTLYVWDVTARLGNGMSLAPTVHTWREGEGLTLDALGDVGVNQTYRSEFTVDEAGRFYFTDTNAHTVVRFDPATRTKTAVAGPGTGLFAGSGVDDGLSTPTHLCLDREGNLLVTDSGHKQVKRIPADKR